MSYKINYNNYDSVFAVPKVVADEHIKMCSGVALKALMVILSSGKNLPEISEISKIIGYSEEDTLDGINFWKSCGVLTDDEGVKAEPVKLKEKETEKSYGEPVKKLGKRAHIERREVLEYVSRNSELTFLVQEFQQLSGKTLTSSDMESLVALYTYYGLSIDYIIMAAHYCYSKGKCSMKYVETTVSSWLDLGVDTHEKLDAHIKKLSEQQSEENLIKSAFGISGRNLITSEKKMTEKWLHEYNFDISMIKLAYERTIERIGKLSFNYLDKILESWNKENIRTPKDAVQEELNFKASVNEEKQEVNNCGGSDTSYTHDDLDDIINGEF